MNTSMMLVIAGLIVATGDFALFGWVSRQNNYLLGLGIILNLIGILIYATTLSSRHIGIATCAFLGVNILVTTLGGTIFLNDVLSRLQIFGVVMLVISLGIIEIL